MGTQGTHRGAYRIVYREIARMAENRALEAPMARKIVRKSGLRRTVAAAPAEGFARTLVDAWVSPQFSNLNYQWFVDLTGVTKIRFVVRAGTIVHMFLAYSLDGFASTALDPGDYALFPTLFPDDPYFYPTSQIQAFSGDSEMDGGNPWALVREDLRVPMRLSLTIGIFGGDPFIWDTSPGAWGGTSDEYDNGFSVGVEVL